MYRVTQSMLSNNTLRHISEGYKRLAKLENQLSTNKKINRPSDDPVSAMQGIRYRSEVVETKQFLERNISQVNSWMENSDTSLDKVTQAMHRLRELTVQGANDSYEGTQRTSISNEVDQILEHLGSLANTRVNNKYIFNGTNTDGQPVDLKKFNVEPSNSDFKTNPSDYFVLFNNVKTQNGETTMDLSKFSFNQETSTGVLEFTYQESQTAPVQKLTVNTNNNEITFNDGTNPTQVVNGMNVVIAHNSSMPSNNNDVKIEVMKGIELNVNVKPKNVFSPEVFGDIALLSKALKGSTTGDQISPFIEKLEKHVQTILSERAELGARSNRVEMIETRVAEQEVTATQVMSQNEDIDTEKVIMELKSQEVLHRAAMAAGARIMQPTLMDFLR